MARYKPGDLVKVKEDANEIWRDFEFVDDMEEHLGKVYKIINVDQTDGACRLENCKNDKDNYIWWWHEDWLEPYIEKSINIEEDEIFDIFR